MRWLFWGRFSPLLKWVVFFEASKGVAKIGSGLKSNRQIKLSLSKSLKLIAYWTQACSSLFHLTALHFWCHCQTLPAWQLNEETSFCSKGDSLEVVVDIGERKSWFSSSQSNRLQSQEKAELPHPVFYIALRFRSTYIGFQ